MSLVIRIIVLSVVIFYTALCRAHDKDRIEGTFIDGWLCMRKQDVEKYIKNPRKRGRLQKERV